MIGGLTMRRAVLASTCTVLAWASVVSTEKCCLCNNCESPLRTISSVCQDADDAVVSLSDKDQQCVRFQASYRDYCCAPTAVASTVWQRNEDQRHLQYSECRLCVDGDAPGRSCGGITVGLQGGGQRTLSCGDWYTEGRQGSVHPRTCNILGAAEREENTCGCDRSIVPASCGGDFTADPPTSGGFTADPPTSGSGGGGGCFSGENQVHVRGRGHIRMDDLRVGDFVADSLNGTFSCVYSMAHIDSFRPSLFLQIYAKGLQQPLEVTWSHLLFVSNKAVLASQVKIGDILGSRHEVLDIQLVHRAGIYNPLTFSGTIVANGIVASNYVGLLSEVPFGLQHIAAHIITSPVRVFCSGMYGHFCPDETHDATGISSWIQLPFRLAVQLNSSSMAPGYLQVVVASLVFAAVFPFLALSLCAEHASSFLGQCLFAVLLGLTYFFWRCKGDRKTR